MAEEFLNAAASFRETPNSSRRLDGVQKYISILESTLDTDTAARDAITLKMDMIAVRSADLLCELGSKSPVSWQLVGLLSKICSSDEAARVKASECKYLISVLGSLLAAEEWPASEVVALADLLALVTFKMKIDFEDVSALTLIHASMFRLAAVEESDDERVLCASGLILLHCFEANPTLTKHITTDQMKKIFQKGKTELSEFITVALMGVLTPVLANDVIELATGELPTFKALKNGLIRKDWRLCDAASFTCSLNPGEETQGIFDVLQGIDWSESPGVCVGAGLRYFRQVAIHGTNEGRLNAWKIALWAMKTPNFERDGFELGNLCIRNHVSCSGVPNGELPEEDDGESTRKKEAGDRVQKDELQAVFLKMSDWVTILTSFQKIFTAAARSPEYRDPSVVADFVDFIDGAVNLHPDAQSASKFVSAALCYFPPEAASRAVTDWLLLSPGSSSKAGTTAAVRLLGFALRRFAVLDKPWAAMLGKLLGDGDVVAAVMDALVHPETLEVSRDARVLFNQFSQEHSDSEIFEKTLLASSRKKAAAQAPNDSFYSYFGGLSYVTGRRSRSSTPGSNDSGVSAISHEVGIRGGDVRSLTPGMLDIMDAYENKIKEMNGTDRLLRVSLERVQTELNDLIRNSTMERDDSLRFRRILRETQEKLEVAERNLIGTRRKHDKALVAAREEFNAEKAVIEEAKRKQDEVIGSLNAKVSALEGQLAAAEAAKSHLSDQLAKVEGEKAELAGKLSLSATARQELETKSTDLEKRITHHEREIKSLRRELKESKAQIDEQLKVAKKLQTENQHQEKMLDDKNKELQELRSFRAAILNVAHDKTINQQRN